MKRSAVVLLSGGLDSCVTAAVAAQSHDLALFHLDYAHRTHAREHRAFCDIADFYAVPGDRRMVVASDYLARIGGSALTDRDIPIPQAQPRASTGVPATYVPFRNAHLLSMGVSWAETIGATAVYIGVVEDDSPGYPDCTEAFCSAFRKAVRLGSRDRIDVLTPLIHYSKSDIVRLGDRMGAPLDLTWSCYEREGPACGRCESCRLRRKAFQEAGLSDPVAYATATS